MESLPILFGHREILGCVSHGDTIPEALEWIELARVDFIYFLLEDGLPVPDPQPLRGHVRVSMSDFGQDFVAATRDSGAPCATILQNETAVVLAPHPTSTHSA